MSSVFIANPIHIIVQLYTVFFSRAGKFRVFRVFLENRENIQPRKKTIREKKDRSR